MPRIRLTSIYFIVVNLLLFHLLLDIPREVAYRFELYQNEWYLSIPRMVAVNIYRQHKWYWLGVLALALLVVLAHLVALGLSLISYGVLRGLEAFKQGRYVLETVRPFELLVLLAFFYVNFVYFDTFIRNIQAAYPSVLVPLKIIKMALFFLTPSACVVAFYRYKVHILNFLETCLTTLGWVAKVSLVLALGLSTVRIAYKIKEDKSCANPSTTILQSYAGAQTDREWPNVIVLTYDELSAEHMSLYGYFRKTSPFLEEFAKTCTVFDNIRAISSKTEVSLITFLLGKTPETWGPRRKAGFVSKQDNKENLLRILETLGYSIGVTHLQGHPFVHTVTRSNLCPDIFPGLRFHGNFEPWQGFWGFPRDAVSKISFGLLEHEWLSFAHSWIYHIQYLHNSMLGRVRRGTWKIAGRPLPPVDTNAWLREQQDLMLPFLEQQLMSTKEPVFLWIHSYPPHPPFEPPIPYFGRYLKSQETDAQLREATGLDTGEASKKLRARYDEYILYVDAGIAEALEIIKQARLLNPWILLIASDHGTRPRITFSDANQEETFHIPLIVCEAGQANGRRVQAPGGTLDFAPTILELIGVEPPDWMEGKSLVRFMERGR